MTALISHLGCPIVDALPIVREFRCRMPDGTITTVPRTHQHMHAETAPDGSWSLMCNRVAIVTGALVIEHVRDA